MYLCFIIQIVLMYSSSYENVQVLECSERGLQTKMVGRGAEGLIR